MEVMFLEAPYDGVVELDKETLDYIKKFQKIGIYASVQFVNNLEMVKKQLKNNAVEVVTSKPRRAHENSQLLGCDVYHNSLNLDQVLDAFLYIGDGRFHPLALVYGQDKEIICFDPIAKKMIVLAKEDVERINKKKKGSLVKFLSSKNIGVVVTIKPGQEQLKVGFMLESKYPDKIFYYFIDNDISFGQLENFPFVDVWVNTACPRIGLDDIDQFRKGVVNLTDVLAN